MKFIVTPNLVINADHVGYAERHKSGEVVLHLTLPQAGIAPGMYPAGSPMVGGTDHVQIQIQPGPHADHIWQSLSAGGGDDKSAFETAVGEKMERVLTNLEGKMSGNGK